MAFKPVFEKKSKIKTATGAPERAEEIKEELITLAEERVYREGTVRIKDLIAPSSFKVEPSLIQLGDVFLRTIFVVSYPRFITVGWSTPILNLNVSMDISMFFYPVKSAIILKQLKKKVGTLEAQITADADKGAPRDPIRETALRDVEQLRDSLTQGTEHFFQFAFYVTIYSKNREELDRLTDEIENVFGGKLINSKKVLFQAEQGFNSTLPLGIDEIAVAFNMNSSPIASSFPFFSPEWASDSGVLSGFTRHNSSLILLDRFCWQSP